MQATTTMSPQAGIAAPDADVAKLARHPCEGAAVVRLGAVASKPGAKLTCRVIFWDALGVLAATTSPVTFTADTAPFDGALHLAVPEPDAWFPVGGPSIFSVHVDSLTPGSVWTITPMAQ